MTNPDHVHYLLIIDRSGSMADIREDMNGGLRSFVADQLATAGEGKRTVSLYQFDTIHDCVLDFRPLSEAAEYKLEPRGGTALLDAIGNAVTGVGNTLKHMKEEERPGQVMVLIVTDGQENSSREYHKPEIKRMTEHQQEKYGWKFTYLGANQDAFAEAASLGILYPSTLSWMGTSRSTGTAWASASAGMSASTAPTTGNVTYTVEQREETMK